jgi:DNA-binding PadR family transcriptional regulator
MRGETLKGHLDMLVLAAIRDGATHGYAVIERVRAQSGGAFELPEGTIYPVLHRLERAGALKSRWIDAGGRQRRAYALTLAGRRLLLRQQREWTLFARAVASVVGSAS